MRRPPALYSHPEGPRHLWEKHLPHLPGRLRAVLALWVEGTLLGLNGCQDAVTLALASASYVNLKSWASTECPSLHEMPGRREKV